MCVAPGAIIPSDKNVPRCSAPKNERTKKKTGKTAAAEANSAKIKEHTHTYTDAHRTTNKNRRLHAPGATQWWRRALWRRWPQLSLYIQNAQIAG